MHKRKDGKIIASLTEVKNKTGDIFALVDEFGEVTLTSYNKPKYRISKVDILETLKIEEEKEEKEKPQPKADSKKEAKKKIDQPQPKADLKEVDKKEEVKSDKKSVIQKVVETVKPAKVAEAPQPQPKADQEDADEKKEEPQPEADKKVKPVITPVVEDKPEQKIEESTPQPQPKADREKADQKDADKGDTHDLKVWDRNNEKEKAFTANALKPLQ